MCFVSAMNIDEHLCLCAVGPLAGAINARAWSSYFDFLFNSAISNFTETYVGHWTVGPPLARSVSSCYEQHSIHTVGTDACGIIIL